MDQKIFDERNGQRNAVVGEKDRHSLMHGSSDGRAIFPGKHLKILSSSIGNCRGDILVSISRRYGHDIPRVANWRAIAPFCHHAIAPFFRRNVI
jgi:hypothetical protein